MTRAILAVGPGPRRAIVHARKIRLAGVVLRLIALAFVGFAAAAAFALAAVANGWRPL